MTSNLRRNHRFNCEARVALAWDDELGDIRYGVAKCRDVSVEGFALETMEPVPIDSYITFRSEQLHLWGRGTVRYCRRVNAKYVLGVSFCAGVRYPTPSVN